ncbi:MAG: bifunctional (p)ppGpp synthetase/guanosine-3',5'-bis(diphosphate) 3'-pyrophosphohydrolase [Saprospiraceae bacterium]
MAETIVKEKGRQEKDRELIIAAYRTLLHSIKSDMDAQDKKNIRKAYDIAVEAHSKQRRKSGEPYILHPIEVARICAAEIGLGPTAIVAALLHDVVEDTDVTLAELREQFGDRIADIVDGLTKLDASTQVVSQQAENFKKVISTLVEDVRVVLIKMADRLHNMRTLGAMRRDKQLKIAAETSYVYAPLAHRLGLYAIKTEFQDLCMKITDSGTYKEIARKLNETKAARSDYIERFIEPMRKELDEIGVAYRITGRPKSIFSIWNKLKTKKVPFEEIYDLFAVRIIVDVPPKREKPICWWVYSTVTDIYKPIPERLKDWITTPKANGYESLHTTVIGPDGRYVEVQIRSERMDEIAERGFAAHWKYKGVSPQPNVYDIWLDNVRETLDTPDGDAVSFLNDFKTNLFAEEIYAYTPKGDMKVLPKGATALDFAFSIHTEVGYHATAIKVNNRLVPMGHELQNGDQVQVTTNRSQKPTESWLKMVVTGKARSKIRSAMKEEKRKQGEFGKESLERKFKKIRVDFEESVETLVKYFKYQSHVDLYFDIANEQLTTSDIFKKFKVESGKLVEIPAQIVTIVERQESSTRSRPNKVIGKPRLEINGESAENLHFHFATCCNPVQGDDIFAYLTSNAGLKIHRSNCPNAVNLMANYGYRVMKAAWVSTTSTKFVAELLITGIDDGVGVIESLTHEISSNLGYNIRSMNISGDEGYYEAKIGLLVANTNQLNIVMRKLENLDNVSTVSRVE